jgi:hypothetical protein
MPQENEKFRRQVALACEHYTFTARAVSLEKYRNWNQGTMCDILPKRDTILAGNDYKVISALDPEFS